MSTRIRLLNERKYVIDIKNIYILWSDSSGQIIRSPMNEIRNDRMDGKK